jgi:predicted transcriptional regulator
VQDSGYNNRRWKAETRLNLLKERRACLEAKNNQIIADIKKAIFEESWSAELTSHATVLMPKDAMSRLEEHLGSKDKSIEAKRLALHDIASELRKAEAEIDCQIEAMLT